MNGLMKSRGKNENTQKKCLNLSVNTQSVPYFSLSVARNPSELMKAAALFIQELF